MRRFFVYDHDARKVVEVSAEQRPRTRSAEFMEDTREPYRSPVDGSMITSRADRREHNRRNGVRGLDPSEDPRKQSREPRTLATAGIARDLYRAAHGYTD